MSTPFPLEEAAQSDSMRPTWDPSKGPMHPGWFAGMGFNDETAYLGPIYRTLEAAGSGVTKGEGMLAGAIHQGDSTNLSIDDAGGLIGTPGAPADEGSSINRLSTAIEADAQARVKAMTPNPATTGAATQLLHGLVSGGTEMVLGGLVGGPAGAAAVVGGSEGHQRYVELREQGVDEATAERSGVLSALTSAAGVYLPAGVGAGLVSKVVTGALGNTGFGIANRYADHRILKAAGYHEMAEQQAIMDGTQVLTDLVLGAAFGGLAHLHSGDAIRLRASGATDEAMTANIANQDRKAAPGIPVDPEAASAHQAALEKSIADLMEGKPVDVSDAGVTESHFLERQEPHDPEAVTAVRDAVHNEDLAFGAENERDVEAILTGREPESVKSEPEHQEEGYTVGEQELTDEQRQAFEGLRSELPAAEELGGSRERASGQPRDTDDGRSREEAREPLTVFRGADRELAPEHFELNALGHATGHPSSGLGVFFSKSKSEAARYGAVSEHHLDLKNPKVIKAEDLPGFNSTHEANEFREKLRAQGHDGIVIDASHLGGPVNYVAFKPEQVFAKNAKQAQAVKEQRAAARPVDPTEQALADHPDMKIRDESGNEVSAREALAQAQEDLATERKEAKAATQAAITCYMRRGN